MPDETLTEFYCIWCREAMVSALIAHRRFSFISTRLEPRVTPRRG